MPIGLKIKEIRLEAETKDARRELYESTSAISRFYLVFAQVKEILAEAKKEPHILYVITCPEDCISSIRFRESTATRHEYDWMVAVLGALISKTNNVLLMPGTIAYPSSSRRDYFINPAPIFFKNQFHEYLQRFVAPTEIHRPYGRTHGVFEVIRAYKHVQHHPDAKQTYEFEFNDQMISLYPQIGIEHHSDTLEPLLPIDHAFSLQVVLSDSISKYPPAIRAGTFVHTDFYQECSGFNQKNGAEFDLQELTGYTIPYNWNNYWADVSTVGSLLCLSHHAKSTDFTQPIQTAQPQKAKV